MTTFGDFTGWLFPNQPIAYQANPTSNLPEEIDEILGEIADNTGIPDDWLEKTAGFIVDGLAGLRCLWYLHGASGIIKDENPPFALQGDLREELSVLCMEAGDRATKKARGDVIVNYISNWNEGVIVEDRFDAATQKSTKPRVMKLGRWLRKQGASSELLHAFETRELPTWDWKISAHPYDILTMSHRRPWTSCMRPESGYEWEYGILSDLAAGSALLFFYRPGAGVPCGRLILRPMLDTSGQPAITSGRTIYGDGPSKLSAQRIEVMLEDAGYGNLRVYEKDVCRLGQEGRALSRQIYSDLSGGCRQSTSAYDSAYYNLGNAGWPPPVLNVGHLRSVSEEWEGEIECELPFVVVEGLDIQKEVATIYAIEDIKEKDAWDVLGLIQERSQDAKEIVNSYLTSEYPHIDFSSDEHIETLSEIEWEFINRLRWRLSELLRKEPVLLLVYPKVWKDLSKQTKDFFDTVIESRYIFFEERIGDMSGTWRRPADWYPLAPDDALVTARSLISDKVLLDDGREVRGRRLYYHPGDPRQLVLGEIEPTEARTIVAVALDEIGLEEVERAWEEARDDDEEEPAFIREAEVIKELPPGVYDWADYSQLEHD